MKFSTMLRRWRKRQKLSQKEASDKVLGNGRFVTLATYRNWEYGRNEPNPIVRELIEQNIKPPAQSEHPEPA